MSKKLNKTVPQLRFPEFEGDWQRQELRKVLIESNVMASIDLPLYSLTIESGIVPKTERYERSFLVKNEEEAYKVVQPNDFAYNPMNLRFGALARHIESRPVKVSKYYNIFSVNPKENVLFVDYLLTKSSSIRFYDSIAMGSLVEKKRVHFSDFLNCKFLLPSIAEQEKIASFLGAVDTRLNQLRRKRELLQTYKRGVMQKLFSQEVRFKEAIGSAFPEWEKKDFQDIATKISSKYDPTPHNTSYPCIELESIVPNEGKLIKIFNSKEQQSIKNKFKRKDILFGKLRPYLRKFIFADFDGVCSTEIWVLRGKKVSSQYLYYLVQSNRFYKVSNVTFGSKMPRSDWDFISTFPFEFPCEKEQEKIATFLAAIDRKIEAISRQIEGCDQFKQGLLQKMFV
jgi:type I restriction enzyme S subunit